MEFPGAWNRLTASLNAADSAGSPERVGDFLVDEGLVRNQSGDRATFIRVYTETSAQHEAARAAGAIIGTLIDASELEGLEAAAPLPPAFDDCVRDRMQTLELPPMSTGAAFSTSMSFDLVGDDQDAGPTSN